MTAPTGQARRQLPQWRQCSCRIMKGGSPPVMQLCGQTATQLPQPMQASVMV